MEAMKVLNDTKASHPGFGSHLFREQEAAGDACAPPAFRCKGVRLIEFPLITDPRGNLMYRGIPETSTVSAQTVFCDVRRSTRKRPRRTRPSETGANHRLPEGVDGSHRGRRLSARRTSAGIGRFRPLFPPLTWGVQSQHSDDCVMLVLASDVYDESGYLRNYTDFLTCVEARAAEELALG